MGVARFITILLAAVLCPLLAQAESKEGKIKEGQEELFRSVLRHNAAARERIKSYVIEQEWTRFEKHHEGRPTIGQQESVTSHHKMRITSKNHHYHLIRTEHLETISGSWSEERRYECALNDRYFAEYRIIDDWQNSIRLVEHRALDTMSSDMRQLATQWFPRPCAIDYISGGVLPVVELFERSPDSARWSISDYTLDSDPVYRIEQVFPLPDGRQRLAHFYIDPHRNFLSRGYDTYDLEGVKSSTMRIIRFEDVGKDGQDKNWFPVEILSEDIAEGTRLKMIVLHVELNIDVDESKFLLDSFAIRPNAILHRTGGDGRSLGEYRHVDGTWKKK